MFSLFMTKKTKTKIDNVNFSKKSNQGKEKKIDYKKLADEYLSGWKRERSDFENYKKQEIERNNSIREFSNQKMLLNILDIIDNFELALKHTPKTIEKDNWFKGVEYIKNSIDKFLEDNGVKKIKTIGERFNHDFHEALDGKGDTVKDEIRAGYMYKDKLLRPARVKLN